MSRRALLVAALALAAFSARAGYGLWKASASGGNIRYDAGARPAAFWDQADPDHYVRLALTYADTGTLAEDGRPTAHREPVYPVLLGWVFKLFGRSYLALLAANCLLGTLSVLALGWCGRRLFGERVGFAAAALAAVYPPFVYYAAQPLRETAMVLAGTLAVASLLWAADRRPAASAAAGAVNALAGLTNTTFLPFGLLCAPLAAAFLRRRAPGAAALGLAAYFAVFLPLYAAWPVRNYLSFGRWILGSTAGGGGTFYVYLIVPQEAGGTPEQGEIMSRDPVLRASVTLDAAARERYFWKAGLERVRRAPGAFLRLVAWRFFWDQWRFYPRPRPYEHSYGLLKAVGLLTDGWIIPLALMGLLWARLRPPECLWIYLFLGSVNLVYSLVLTMLRYRLSLMPWVILLASVALCRLAERAFRRAA